MNVEVCSENLDSGPDAFRDTAAILEQCDLVITSDTSVAHLAGAMDRPTWIALKHTPDWRWGLEGSMTPWYPSMRLFRQRRPGEWQAVFEAIEFELREPQHRAPA
jgi:ADP-heptose:LPS heptosyltransferase